MERIGLWNQTEIQIQQALPFNTGGNLGKLFSISDFWSIHLWNVHHGIAVSIQTDNKYIHKNHDSADRMIINLLNNILDSQNKKYMPLEIDLSTVVFGMKMNLFIRKICHLEIN